MEIHLIFSKCLVPTTKQECGSFTPAQAERQLELWLRSACCIPIPSRYPVGSLDPDSCPFQSSSEFFPQHMAESVLAGMLMLCEMSPQGFWVELQPQTPGEASSPHRAAAPRSCPARWSLV